MNNNQCQSPTEQATQLTILTSQGESAFDGTANQCKAWLRGNGVRRATWFYVANKGSLAVAGLVSVSQYAPCGSATFRAVMSSDNTTDLVRYVGSGF